LKAGLFAGIVLVLNLLLQLIIMSHMPSKYLENPSTFILITYFIPLLVFSYAIGCMLYSYKTETFKWDTGYAEVLSRQLRNVPNLIFVIVVGSIFALTVVLSPLLPLALASNIVSYYNGIEAFAEAFLRLRRYSKKELIEVYSMYVLVLVILASSYFALIYVSPLQRPLFIAFTSTLILIVILKNTCEIFKEYMCYGLKLCVYCETENPIEAIYCRECGFRLRR